MRLKLKRFIKKMLLNFRAFLFHLLSLFTFFLRRQKLEKDKVKNVLVIAQKRIGDTVVSIPAFRAIRNGLSQSRIFVFAPSYIRDIMERIGEIDHIIEFDSGLSLFNKAKKIREFSGFPYELAIDLTCDYTLEGALLTFLSRAKYRVGYDTFGRGLLFNKSIPHKNRSIPMSEEILEITRSIGLDTKDKNLKITPSDLAQKEASQFLREQKVTEEELLIGIHPGGHYPTQRWLTDRFAELADRLIERYPVKVVLLGGPKELELIDLIKNHMEKTPIFYVNKPVRNLLALIQSCHLLLCNNSGPLHLATALETPTVSLMGPTQPERWWPQGEGHTVLRKNLSCMPCNEGVCERKTVECLKLITVDEVFEAVKNQLAKLK